MKKWPEEDPNNPDEINRDYPPYGYSKVTTKINWNKERLSSKMVRTKNIHTRKRN